jgi:hypothetical protein
MKKQRGFGAIYFLCLYMWPHLSVSSASWIEPITTQKNLKKLCVYWTSEDFLSLFLKIHNKTLCGIYIVQDNINNL